MTTPRKIVLVTGGNAGLGYECCRALAKMENMHVIVAGRNPQRLDSAIQKIKAEASPSTIVERGIVDLASLRSVRYFADQLRARELQLFTLVCNAGLEVKEKWLTEDGFEGTIGVNHIGHFLLIKLLMDQTERVVMLSSETHDPAEKTGVTPPNLSNLDELARGYDKFDVMEAYSTSKLCNLMVAKELVRRHPNGPQVLAFTPGFTPDTGLFRERNAFVFGILQYVICFYLWTIGGRSSTSKKSGGIMADIAAEESWSSRGWRNGDYIQVDVVRGISAEASDPALGKALWDKSEEWVKPFAR